MSAYLSGLLLGLAIIIPIGASSLFVLNQGLQIGFPRALVGVSTVCLCDSLLIVLGAVGASALLVALGYKELLIALGSIFLVVLGLITLSTRPSHDKAKAYSRGTVAVVAQAVAVSLLNPHAILDTIGVIGAVIATRAVEEQVLFGVGTLSATWVWFFTLCIGAVVVRPLFTESVKLWIQRGSGLLMLLFAAILMSDLW